MTRAYRYRISTFDFRFLCLLFLCSALSCTILYRYGILLYLYLLIFCHLLQCCIYQVSRAKLSNHVERMAPAMRSSLSQTSASSRPLRSSRTKVESYYEESSSENDFDERNESEDESPMGAASSSLRPRVPTSYREDSKDDSFDEEEGTPSPSSRPVVATQPADSSLTGSYARIPCASTTRSRRSTEGSTKSSTKRRLQPERPLRQNKHQKMEDYDPGFAGSRVIPPWQSLPYYILLDIMFYASRPLVDRKAGIRLKSVQWLLDMALLCRAFHEPSLSALYYCPPLIPAARCHGLLNLLSREQGSLSTNYSNKVKVLDVDVESVLLPRNSIPLHELIAKTPQLRELHLYHRNDYVVGLPSWQTPQSRWTYQEEIFMTLNARPIHLQSWDWNGRFMATPHLLPFMVAVHQLRSFRSLRELRIFNLGGSVDLSEEDEMTIAIALEQLPDLRRLEFRDCAFFGGELLGRLPSNLTSLTMTNCDGVTAADLEIFLSSRGGHLRELCLNHNRFLSLFFLQGLGKWCGRLEKLNMDLSMHDWSSYHDVEPRFDTLITAEETPTWPATLREIEFVQLRKWDVQAAEAFFTSLVKAAPMLPDLRRLVITAILKVGWRDRATFREKWIDALETAFLRRSDPAEPTLAAYPQSRQHFHTRTPPPDGHNTPVDIQPSSAQSTSSKRKSERIARRDSTADEPPYMFQGIPYRIQGMCDLVKIRIDNQRPAEMQFNESDFLDDEQSGDEDWSGQDLYVPTHYAW